jgi:acetyl esterase/lipase
MSAKGLLLLTAALVATSSLPGQNPARPKGGWGKQVELKVPANVEVVPDIVYATYGGRQLKLDLYLPKPRPAKPVPGIIGIRGGGWQRGDKEGFAPITANLAARGFAAASIEYRTMKEAKFPACVNDCKAAVRWMRAEGSRYGIRPNAIGAIGGSAGGHLAALLGTSYKATDLEGDGGHPGISSRVQAVVAMAPVFDFRTLAGVKEKGGEVPRTLFANDEKQLKLFSPATYLDADSAPVLLMHSMADDTVPYRQSLDMLESAKKAGVRAELWSLTEAPHFFWNIEKWFPETIDRAANFFNFVFDQGGK